MGGQDGKGRELCWLESMTHWWEWVPAHLCLGEDQSAQWGARGGWRTLSTQGHLGSGNFLSKSPGKKLEQKCMLSQGRGSTSHQEPKTKENVNLNLKAAQ